MWPLPSKEGSEDHLVSTLTPHDPAHIGCLPFSLSKITAYIFPSFSRTSKTEVIEALTSQAPAPSSHHIDRRPPKDRPLSQGEGKIGSTHRSPASAFPIIELLICHTIDTHCLSEHRDTLGRVIYESLASFGPGIGLAPDIGLMMHDV